MANADLISPHVPSMRRLAAASAIALAAAVVILVAAVLPAEYGVDPIGTGQALGLVALTEAEPPIEEPTVVPASGLVPTPLGAAAYYPGEYRFDTREITLEPYDYVEYKYRLEKGAQMLFSWTASAPVIQDFHGEPDGGPRDYSESFDKRARQRANGSFTAPFAGIHGWYWENPGADTITIRLTTAGFYSAALEIGSDRTREARDVKTLSTLAAGEN